MGGVKGGSSSAVPPKNGLDAIYRDHDVAYSSAEAAPNPRFARYIADQKMERDIIAFKQSVEWQMLDPLTVAERQALDAILGKLCFRSDGWNSTY
jgi:hypothetical protein